MEAFNFILNILILVGLGLLIWLVPRYLSSYTKEKGKNLATKEDIEAITEKIERVKSEIGIDAALRQAFRVKCMEAIEAVNIILTQITLYCWRELAKRSLDEHYVWDAVEIDNYEEQGFLYFCVTLDKTSLENGLYLSRNAKTAIKDLSQKLRMLGGMELALMADDPDPLIEQSAESGYKSGLHAVEKCRDDLFNDLGFKW